MGFDGIFRPSQVNIQSDSMNPYLAANAAKTERMRKPLIKGPDQDEQVKSLQKEEKESSSDDECNDQETLTEEEAEQLHILAKMRGLLNFSLQNGVRYEFHINSEDGLIDLIEAESGKVMLRLLPEEMLRLSEKIQRYAGMLIDRSG